jgi:uncharacterized protein YukE
VFAAATTVGVKQLQGCSRYQAAVGFAHVQSTQAQLPASWQGSSKRQHFADYAVALVPQLLLLLLV